MEADFKEKIRTGTSKFQSSIISEQYESCGEASRSRRYRPTLLGYTPSDEGPGSIPISADESKNQLKFIVVFHSPSSNCSITKTFSLYMIFCKQCQYLTNIPKQTGKSNNTGII
jgi:hypothetical protein